MKKTYLILPVLFVALLVLLSTTLDGINPYDVPLPFGWLSDTDTPTLNAGCTF